MRQVLLLVVDTSDLLVICIVHCCISLYCNTLPIAKNLYPSAIVDTRALVAKMWLRGSRGFQSPRRRHFLSPSSLSGTRISLQCVSVFLGCCDGTKSDVVSPLSMVEEWQSEQLRSFLLVWCPSRYYGVCKKSSRNKQLYQSFGLCYE